MRMMRLRQLVWIDGQGGGISWCFSGDEGLRLVVGGERKREQPAICFCQKSTRCSRLWRRYQEVRAI
jgi:hypothetical protein